MKSNKIGFTAVILCLLFLNQASSSVSASINSADSLSKVSTVENTTSESTLLSLESAPAVSKGLDTVAIVVENALYSSISAAVTQYRQDLNDTGYHTILYTNSIFTAEQLKANLSNWYDSEDLLGAVLIGRLPYAQFYHAAAGPFSAETFICDLFLTDLDGTWIDTNPSDGVYDSHSSTTGTDIFPEIFIGRIDPTCLTWGTSVADHINTYLARIHDYRTGGVTRNRRALFYIDDDWEPWAVSWSSDAAPAYSTRMLVSTPTTTTTATDWLNNRITQNYQWGHLCAHSSPTTHYFGPEGSGEGTVSSSQVHAAPPSFNFYNLFCCSGAKWTFADDLGVTYTFSGSYSLASIGSSKTGSMMNNAEFYGPLGQNATLGESLRDWFSASLTPSNDAGEWYLEWYYGMNIIGDPLLSIYYDTTVRTPTISSSSHPNPILWYNNPRPQINWTVPPEVNEIAGYYFIADQNPTTIPDRTTGTYTTINGTLPAEDLASGTWYYHVVAVDSVGNIGKEAAHYTVNIDNDSPEITLIDPIVNGASVTLVWNVSDATSGFDVSRLYIDGTLNATSSTINTTIVVNNLSYGQHVFNITVFDLANNAASVGVVVNLVQPFPDVLLLISAGAIILVIVLILAARRRR